MSEKEERLKRIDEIECAMRSEWLAKKSSRPWAENLRAHWRTTSPDRDHDVDLIIHLPNNARQVVQAKALERLKQLEKLERELEAASIKNSRVAVPTKVSRQRPLRMEVAPGFKLHGFLRSVCTRRFTEDVLDQLLRDGTDMYQEYLAAGDFTAAQRVRWAMRWWMVRSVCGGVFAALLGFIVGKKKTSE